MIEEFGHWDISSVGSFRPEDHFGFLYEIGRIKTGQLYIGKKQFLLKKTTRKLLKKHTVYVPSDWKTYRSSCLPLKNDITLFGEDAFRFKIILLCSGKCMLSYMEQSYQFRANVLLEKLPNGDQKYWNRNIGNHNYRSLDKQIEESRLKTVGSQINIR